MALDFWDYRFRGSYGVCLTFGKNHPVKHCANSPTEPSAAPRTNDSACCCATGTAGYGTWA